MTLKNKIEKIITAIKDTNISEIEISSFWGAQKIKLKTTNSTSGESTSSNIEDNISKTPDSTITHQDLNSKSEIVEEEKITVSDTVLIKAPLVGTFYASSKPGEAPFVDVGSNIKIGDPLCIIEAMKIFNTIESENIGKIVEIFVDDGQPIEFGQDLFSIKEVDV